MIAVLLITCALFVIAAIAAVLAPPDHERHDQP